MPKGIYTRSKEKKNRKISESMMGHPVSEETRRKMSAKRKAYWDRLRAENRMPNWKKRKGND